MKPPLVTSDLVDYLKETYPLGALLEPRAGLSDLHIAQGQHMVIAHLDSLIKRQERRALESSTTV